ncbi:hypothetical protein QTP70_018816 [Hemibagrus guttatus]|uniref:Uncharacterized protein n=1 Tax=Hemibagrus guttatus TaxID=175788 RepID=A0AAE0R7D7_9TELE|nr:hypothetical protein QTP70_018816 [Hemibagrus guttatus]
MKLHVREVLSRLQQHHLYVKLEKCEFHWATVTFLGYMISRRGVEMDVVKVRVVTDWPAPTMVRELQRFLGFANFYRRFIRNYSSVAGRLTSLLRGKPKRLVWTDQAREAFQQLKDCFTMAPILQHLDPDLPFVVEVDTSSSGLRAVLSQRHGEPGKLHPCSAGGVASLAGGSAHPFQVLTDHRNLEYLRGAKRLNPRQARWALFFTRFRFMVTYHPGSKNSKADALSRKFETADEPVLDEPILPVTAILALVCWNLVEEIQRAHAEDPPPADCPPTKIFVPPQFCIQVIRLPSAMQTAEALFMHMFQNFGLHEDIVSDRGSQFTFQVWGSLCARLGIGVSLSSSYHPQSNGQVERLNQEIGRFLRSYCSREQHRWSEFLPWAEYAQNSLIHSSTGLMPFQCVLGYQPPLFPAVEEWYRRSQEVWERAHVRLQRAVHKQRIQADRCHRPHTSCQVGQKVWLSTRNLRLKLPCHKLSPKFIGPFEIVRQVNPVAYRLRLPAAYRICPTFHVSLLKPAHTLAGEVPDGGEPPPPLDVEGSPANRVRALLDSRRVRSRLQYLVDWEGYGVEECSWVEAVDIMDPSLTEDFHRDHPNKPAPRLRGRPQRTTPGGVPAILKKNIRAVVLHAGTNDIGLRQTEILKKDFRSLVEKVRTTLPTTRIIVSGPLPMFQRGIESRMRAEAKITCSVHEQCHDSPKIRPREGAVTRVFSYVWFQRAQIRVRTSCSSRGFRVRRRLCHPVLDSSSAVGVEQRGALGRVFHAGLNPTLQTELACHVEATSLSQFVATAIRLDNLRCQRQAGASDMATACPRVRMDYPGWGERDPEPMQLGRYRLAEEERRPRGPLRQCYHCGSSGHVSPHCPERASDTQVGDRSLLLSLTVPVSLMFSDRCVRVPALIDSGAAMNLIDGGARDLHLPLCTIFKDHGH